MEVTVVPYIGTWIETLYSDEQREKLKVVPYIGTWIETTHKERGDTGHDVVPYIGTWIETLKNCTNWKMQICRTLYRYVD